MEVDTEEQVPSNQQEPVPGPSTRQANGAEEKDPQADEDWNYTEDLEILSRILDQSPGAPVEEIGTLREIIQQFIQRNESLVEAGNALSSDFRASDHSSVREQNPAGNTLTPALVSRVVSQMIEFQNAKNSESSTENSVAVSNGHASNSSKQTSTTKTTEAVNSFTSEFQQVLRGFQDSFCKKWLVHIADPFTNHVVMRTVFEYLPNTDVQTCRYVNKYWSMNGAFSLKNRHSPIRLNGANLLRITRTLITAAQTTMPYSRFEIELGNFLSSKVTPESCTQFFTKLGDHVRYLKIFERSLYMDTIKQTLDEYQTLLRIIFNNTPNLETLILWRIPLQIMQENDFVLEGKDLDKVKMMNMRHLTLFCPGAQDVHSNFFRRLFSWMPKLKTLKLIQKSYGPTGTPVKEPWMGSGTATGAGDIDLVLRRGRCSDIQNAIGASSKLEEIEGDDVFPVGFLGKISKKFKIIRIHVAVENEEHGLELERFINGSHVRVFQITSMHKFQNQQRKLGLAGTTGLTHLDLCHEVSVVPPSTCICVLKPISSHMTPALIYVAGKLQCFESLFSSQDQVFSNVGEVRIKPDFLRHPSNQEPPSNLFEDILRIYNSNLIKFQTIFPNLKKLTVESNRLNASCLLNIFSKLSGLTELDLHISEYSWVGDINYVLSGYPIGTQLILDQLLARRNFDLLQKIEPVAPSLLDMKFLKKLRIEYLQSPEGVPITGFTVHMALLRMRRLQLTLIGCIDISREDVLKLEKHHENFVISSNLNLTS